MKNQKVLILFLMFTLFAFHCSESHEKKKSISLLFIGNSLTYANDLPTLVKKKLKVQKVITDVLAKPNFALEDHWNEGRLQTLISNNYYDFVIIQQGPSSQQDGREMLIHYGGEIKELCKYNRSQLAFFMVWPAYGNFSTFDGVIKNYTDAAAETQSLLLPVGKVWKQHFTDTQDFSYYGPDMFHPSLKGSEAAAVIIADVIQRNL